MTTLCQEKSFFRKLLQAIQSDLMTSVQGIRVKFVNRAGDLQAKGAPLEFAVSL
jgi:hypothetical protein